MTGVTPALWYQFEKVAAIARIVARSTLCPGSKPETVLYVSCTKEWFTLAIIPLKSHQWHIFGETGGRLAPRTVEFSTATEGHWSGFGGHKLLKKACLCC